MVWGQGRSFPRTKLSLLVALFPLAKSGKRSLETVGAGATVALSVDNDKLEEVVLLLKRCLLSGQGGDLSLKVLCIVLVTADICRHIVLTSAVLEGLLAGLLLGAEASRRLSVAPPLAVKC